MGYKRFVGGSMLLLDLLGAKRFNIGEDLRKAILNT
jgi:hypothetical protein